MKKLYGWLLKTIPRPWLIRLSYVFRLFAPLFLKGNKVECPVCTKTYKRFLPYGARQRPNVLCPNCLSLERHRLLWLYLQEKTDFFTAPHQMLHVAPEQCFYHRFKALKNLKYTTADLVSPLAEVKMDLHHIPFPDESYDVILCNHVLEHVEDDRRCMRELFRVLRPGGFAIMQVPMDYTRSSTFEDPTITRPEDREKHFWQKDHLRLYGLDYPDRLREAGFRVEEVRIGDTLGETLRERYRLDPQEPLYVCTR